MVSSAEGRDSVIHILLSKILINAILLFYRLEMFIQIILMSDSKGTEQRSNGTAPKRPPFLTYCPSDSIRL